MSPPSAPLARQVADEESGGGGPEQTVSVEERHAEARRRLRLLVNRYGAVHVGQMLGAPPDRINLIYLGERALEPRFLSPLLAAVVPEPPPPATTREQKRSRRAGPRGRTISVKRMTKIEIETGRRLYPERPGIDYERPKTRGDCERLRGRDESGKLLPCGFVSCRHHLLLDVHPESGAIKVNHVEGLEDLFSMAATCSLDVADEGPHTLEQVGEHLAWTRERQRQVELMVMAKIKAGVAASGLRDHVEEGPIGKRRLPVLQVVREEDSDDEK